MPYKNINGENEKPLFFYEFSTPIGSMMGVFSPLGVCLLDFLDSKGIENNILKIQEIYTSNPTLELTSTGKQLQHELDEYFLGTRKEFSVPLDMRGNEFNLQAWMSLKQIPYGNTISYKQQAKNMQKPSHIRAVANANGKNKLLILIPCHRVIGHDKKLRGFTAGIERKKFLLALEARVASSSIESEWHTIPLKITG